MSGLSIRAVDLIKVYRTRRVRCLALREVSLTVPPGEFVAVTGTSGSGKSTLLNLLAGLERPTSGEIYLGDNPMHRMSEDSLADIRLRHTGFIFQNFNLLPDLTVLENAALPLMLAGADRAVRSRKAAELLAGLGLEEHAAHLPGELSGGQQQRVAIARALITAPDVVFADEPTGNLDSTTADSVMRFLGREVKQRGMTLLMVTHDPARAALADRIVEIRDGCISEIQAGPQKGQAYEEKLEKMRAADAERCSPGCGSAHSSG